MKKYIIKLSKEERSLLDNIIRKGKHGAQKILRARILLKADQSSGRKWLTDAEIASALDTSIPTVERLRRRFVEEGFEASLKNKSRQTPHPNLKLDGELESQIIAVACSECPEGRSRWTLQMIADQLVELNCVDSLSRESVRRGLKKTKSSRGRKNRGA